MCQHVPVPMLLVLGMLACSAASRVAEPERAPPPARPGLPKEALSATPPAATASEHPADLAGLPFDATAFEFEPEVSDDGLGPLVEGAPAPSPFVLRTLDPYLETRRARLASSSSRGDRLIILTRLGETTQAHVVFRPMGMREQVTFGREPVQQVQFQPGSSTRITYRTDVGGDENYQIVDLDLETRTRRLLTDGRTRHGAFRWMPDASAVAFTSSARNGVDMDLYIHKAGSPPPDAPVLERQGEWLPVRWTKDGRLLLREFRAKTEATLYLYDAADGRVEPLEASRNGVVHETVVPAPRSDDLMYVVAARDGDDVKAVWEFRTRDGTWTRLSRSRWDVEEIAVSPDGSRLAITSNEDGVSVIDVVEPVSRRRRRVQSLPRGIIGRLRFTQRRQLAFDLTTATRPADVYTLDLEGDRLTQWTRSETGGLPDTVFVEPSLERIRSFDGVEIPTYVYRPSAAGPHPVLLWIHGGPEEQIRPEFDPLIQYFAGRLGVAVVAPNLRGSQGYGAAFMALDDGEKRFDAIRDVGAVLDWIAAEERLDAKRVGIHGASYGGFVVLASLAEYGRRFVAGSDVVGIANLVTFLENTAPRRRDLRRREYGDERDPKIRAVLQTISPLHNADRIESALLVAHGENDPRVPVAEAEAIASVLRAKGIEVWSFLARGEGHSFRKRRNRDTFYRLMATFFARHLLGHTWDKGSAGAQGTGNPVSAMDDAAPRN
jgi:dipeptidyl aminopeptidase/acylaminoacyl peptidase